MIGNYRGISRRGVASVALAIAFVVLGAGPATQPLPATPFGAGWVTLSGPLFSQNHTVTFSEVGLPAGTHWTVVLGGVRQSSSQSTIAFSESAGSYYWGVLTATAFEVSPAPAGHLTMRFSPVTVNLVFSSAGADHPIQHVVVIVLENEGLAPVLQWGLYQTYLAEAAGQATAYYAACHHSAPNYLAMVAAVTNQCDNSGAISDGYNAYNNTTIGDLIDNSGQFTWAQFAEGLPTTFNCSNPGAPGSSGVYAVKHVPFAFFQNSTSDPVTRSDRDYCGDHIQPSSVFNQSAAGGIGSSSFVNLSFYTPNLCDDGHDVCTSNPLCLGLAVCNEVLQADRWLQGFLGPLLNGTGRYANSENAADNVAHTAFIIAYDESSNPTDYSGYAVPGATQGNNSDYCQSSGTPPGSGDAVCGGQVPLTVVSPTGSPGEAMTVYSSPYSIDATVEWVFGLTGPNGHGMDNPGQLDWKDRWADPGFPTFEWLVGISGNGYAASN